MKLFMFLVALLRGTCCSPHLALEVKRDVTAKRLADQWRPWKCCEKAAIVL